MNANQKTLHRRTTIIGVLISLLLGAPAMVTAQFDDAFKKALTPAQLEELLLKYPDNAGAIVPRLENTLLAEFRSKPDTNRFVIKEITPKPGGVTGNLTISENRPSEFLYFTEYPQDRTTSFTGSFALVETDIKDVSSSEAVPLGDGSIHRFAGGQQKTIKVSNYTFVNEGETHHRLTFCLLEGQGYVYLRGKGVVIAPDGRETKLGY